jgi:hypothetical protein
MDNEDENVLCESVQEVQAAQMDLPFALPREIWVEICSYLSQYQLCQLSLVSKTFLNISRDAILWTNISLPKHSFFRKEERPFIRIITPILTLRPDVILNLIERCPLLKELHISGTNLVSDIVRCLANSCPNVKTITLQGCSPISYSDFHLLSENCQQVETLDLKSTGCLNKNRNAHFIRCCKSTRCDCPLSGSFTNLFSNFSKLTVLNLFKCVNLNNRGLMQIADLCPNLTYINIDEIPNITDESVLYLITKVKARLKHLLLDGTGLTDASFTKLSCLHNLVELSVLVCDYMQPTGFRALSLLTSLQRLTLWQGFNLTPPDFVCLLTWCWDLVLNTVSYKTCFITNPIFTLLIVRVEKLF